MTKEIWNLLLSTDICKCYIQMDISPENDDLFWFLPFSAAVEV